MNKENELKIKFAELHDKIMKECISKKTIEEINELMDVYTEFENIYDDLKDNYGIDYSNKFFAVGNFIVNHAKRLQEKDEKIAKLYNQNNQNPTINTKENQNDNQHEDIDELMSKLVKCLSEDTKFDNTKEIFEEISKIDSLVNKIIDELNYNFDKGLISSNEYNNYLNKVNEFGFKTNSNIVSVLEIEFNKVRTLLNEKEDTKDLGEYNLILKQIFNKLEQIQELLETGKQKGVLNFKQLELYDMLIEKCKEQIYGGKKY